MGMNSCRVKAKSVLVSLCLVIVAGTGFVRGYDADPIFLTHGPMLGLPGADSIRIWGRTSKPGPFHVHYGLSESAMDQVSREVITELGNDNTGWIELTDLHPSSTYHYQIQVNGRPHGQPGSFTTLPTPESSRNPEFNPKGLFNFRFQVGSCANQNPLHGIGHQLPTYETLNRDWADRVHFHIMNGDWLYEELREYPLNAWAAAHGAGQDSLPFSLQVMPTLIGVWENYKLYLSRGYELSKWHRNVPSVFTFDDHELVNDIWGAGTAGKRHRRTVFRDIGSYAWYNYLGWANPTAFNHPMHYGMATMEAGSDLLVDTSADFTRMPLKELLNLHVHWGTPQAGVNDMKYDNDDGHPNAMVYDIVEVVDAHTVRLHAPAVVSSQVAYSIGRPNFGKFRVGNCEFYLLDTRSSRDMHDIRERDRPGLSMVGGLQREWLLDSMKSSDAEFFFVISSVPFMIPHSGAGGFEADSANKEEAWTGFYHEREILISEWEKLNKPVFVMTGDLHNSFAVKITDSIWEFCCGPHNSVNHVPSLDEGNRPANGLYQSGPRMCDIRWSTYILPDIPRLERCYPHFCIVQVNNVFNMPQKLGGKRLVAFPHPQIVFQYYDGRTGELQYAESIQPVSR